VEPLDLTAGHARLAALAAAVAVILTVAGCAPAPSPSVQAPTATPAASAEGTPRPLTPSPPATPPAETDVCVPEAGSRPSAVADPCRPAIAAVRAVVAPLGLPIARIVLQPRPFGCGRDLWPGIGSPTICFGPMIISGTTMHGWVSFRGSPKVAAVLLRLRGAADPSPAPSPRWVATISAFQVPPAGWVMP
jgi:hypothetical protein